MLHAHAHDLISSPQAWSQGAIARDALQSPVLLFSAHATAWDVLGAIHWCYPNRQDRLEIKYRLAFHLRRNEYVAADSVIAGAGSVVKLICDWNDDFTTTHYDVIEVLQTLGI